MHEDIASQIAAINPDALLADGFEDALVGYVLNTHSRHVAVYDYEKCVAVLVERDGMTRDGADEYMEFNVLCAWVGPDGPLYYGAR